MVLNASEPEGFIPIPNTMVYKLAGTPEVDGSGATRFNLQVERTSVQQIDLNHANALARGLPAKTAVRVLHAKLPLAAAPVIELTPAWWPWLPLIPFRISFQ
jgi:hypothetical protein